MSLSICLCKNKRGEVFGISNEVFIHGVWDHQNIPGKSKNFLHKQWFHSL